ncbi:MAG: aminopeptidase P family protein [Clostridia bacterium]|nr:aminopeptidase P family protein [Clostridia bacterium]MBQ5798947.1 aminopeptidase P family protein [Clostridia bacterium]
MAYYNRQETDNRLAGVRKILADKGLDAALVYFDELNVANGWYLTGWCGQFEKGAVLVPIKGEPILLGGPESEPFAQMDSAITKVRCFPVFMVPDEEYPNATIIDFAQLNAELKGEGTVLNRIGIVGTTTIPHQVYLDVQEGFKGAELVDITEEYENMRAYKSPWEVEQATKSVLLCDKAYDAMINAIRPGAHEYEVAAAGEAICRANGANSFAYSTIVGSGARAKAVVPTATNKVMEDGELVMIGIAPRINGYAGTFGDTIPVNGEFTQRQKDLLNHMRETFRLTHDMLKPGMTGREIDVPGRLYYEKHGLSQYIVCPFAHSMGLMEAEAPFFGPNGDFELAPGMLINVDVSFFGHPELHGGRIETGFVITETGCDPLSPKLFDYFMKDL